MDLVRHDLDGGVATLTLDDPARRNALPTDLVRDLLATVDAIERDPAVRALVVTGAPPAFCAGADRSDLRAPTEAGLRGIYEAFLRFTRVRVPTIAAVNGPAVGAGFNLALCCDLRLAARTKATVGDGHCGQSRRGGRPGVGCAALVDGRTVLMRPRVEIGLDWTLAPFWEAA